MLFPTYLGKNDDPVPQSIIFPLGSGNIISSEKKMWKYPILNILNKLEDISDIYNLLVK